MARNVNPKVSLSIQCGMWAYLNCENITHDQYRLIKSLSDNLKSMYGYSLIAAHNYCTTSFVHRYAMIIENGIMASSYL